MPSPGYSHFFGPQGSSSGGAGGGTALLWSEQALAPIKIQQDNFELYAFTQGESQSLWTSIRVPSAYNATSPITLKVYIYSSGTTDDILLSSQSTLIRPGTDLISSTTNQRTSTNSAITLTGSNNDTPLEVSMDLTSSIGEINSVAVSPGDLIKIQIFRGSDTSADDFYFILGSGELSFS